MSAQPLPGAGPQPAGTRHDPALLGPPPAPGPLLPLHPEEPAGEWPADVRLPDDNEDDAC